MPWRGRARCVASRGRRECTLSHALLQRAPWQRSGRGLGEGRAREARASAETSSSEAVSRAESAIVPILDGAAGPQARAARRRREHTARARTHARRHAFARRERERAGPRAYASRALVPPRGPGLTHHVHAASPLHATRGHQLATEGEAGSAADTPTDIDRITLAPPRTARPRMHSLMPSSISSSAAVVRGRQWPNRSRRVASSHRNTPADRPVDSE